MAATIIPALAVLTAALIVGVFIIALIELNKIDEISRGSPNHGGSLLGQTAGSSLGTGEI